MFLERLARLFLLLCNTVAFSRVTDAALLPEGKHEARRFAIGRWSA